MSSALERLQITRASTADQVAARLAELIVSGELAPGTPLPELRLASSLGVSRGAVREAIGLLAHQGLVQRVLHRGAVVTRLDAAAVGDIFAARRALEPAGLEVARREPAGLAALRAGLERMTVAAEAASWADFVEGDLAFHRTLVGLLRSRRLDDFFATIQAELRVGLSIVAAVDREYEQPSALLDQHRRLIEVLESGRLRDARAVLRAHLAESEQRLLEIVGGEATAP